MGLNLSDCTLAQLRDVIRQGEAAKELLRAAMAEAGAAPVVVEAPPPVVSAGPSVQFTAAEMAERARLLSRMRPEMPADIAGAMGGES
jgi:hypothetical protein